MVIKNENNEFLSQQKAKKHIRLCLEAKKQIKKNYPDYCVYLATHSSGRHGLKYQKIENESGEKFWKLPYYSQISRKGKLKEPDIVVVDGNIVKYIIEVKWGAIDGCSDTDALLNEKEIDRIEKAFNFGKKVKISKNETFIFDVDENMKFILISDFQKMKDMLSKQKYNEILTRLKDLQKKIILADISSNVDDIPSLNKIIDI